MFNGCQDEKDVVESLKILRDGTVMSCEEAIMMMMMIGR